MTRRKWTDKYHLNSMGARARCEQCGKRGRSAGGVVTHEYVDELLRVVYRRLCGRCAGELHFSRRAA